MICFGNVLMFLGFVTSDMVGFELSRTPISVHPNQVYVQNKGGSFTVVMSSVQDTCTRVVDRS